MSLSFVDLFCGAGGSSIGLTAAGMTLKLAANHWQRAIETHSHNFPDAEHLCADVSNYDMRRLPTADVLWASPICTELSPAGGHRRTPTPGQTDLLQELGHIPRAGMERTRATFWDVIRATEVHRYPVVLVENVPEAARWELFDHWVQGMRLLGYRVQYVSVSSAHIGGPGNPHAPQWRDRLYLVFSRNDVPKLDVAPRPLALCPSCGDDVTAVQAWKRLQARHIGKYRQQYLYVCPQPGCRGQIVEPYVTPAAAAIDWTDLGTRIGDRPKPLAAKTLARIQEGLHLFADQHTLITVNHGSDATGRTTPVHGAPLPTRTVKIGEGMLTPPLLVPAGGTWNTSCTTTDQPMRTRTAREAEALCIPAAFVATLRNHATAHGIGEPFRTMAAGGQHHALVVPYRRGNRPTTTGQPLNTLNTKESAASRHPAGPHRPSSVDDCRFRMLKPREQLRAQRFPDSYTVTGNIAEQTTQAGNAVSANVAQWLGHAVATALAATSAG